MKSLHLLWHDYRYFSYERALAHREASLVFGKTLREEPSGLEAPRGQVKDGLHLTYFKAVQNSALSVVPDQAKLEASGNGKGEAWDPARQPIPSLRRQSTRYSCARSSRLPRKVQPANGASHR